MTRSEAKLVKEVMKQSAHDASPLNPSSSSIAPGSSALWSHRDNAKDSALTRYGNGHLGADYLAGTMDSETITSYENDPLQKGGLKELGE